MRTAISASETLMPFSQLALSRVKRLFRLGS